MCRNKPTRLFKKAIHFLEWDALGLWQKRPKENGIGHVTDDKEQEVPPAL